MIIRVTVGNNVNRQTKTVDDSTTLRQVLADSNIPYEMGTTHLDGCTLNAGDFDKTFKDFGITSNCFLLNVVKADNA